MGCKFPPRQCGLQEEKSTPMGKCLLCRVQNVPGRINQASCRREKPVIGIVRLKDARNFLPGTFCTRRVR
jgi:hypothetical protein